MQFIPHPNLHGCMEQTESFKFFVRKKKKSNSNFVNWQGVTKTKPPNMAPFLPSSWQAVKNGLNNVVP